MNSGLTFGKDTAYKPLSGKTLRLTFHIFDHDIVKISPKEGAIFQHLPWFIGVKMDFDQLFVTNG